MCQPSQTKDNLVLLGYRNTFQIEEFTDTGYETHKTWSCSEIRRKKGSERGKHGVLQNPSMSVNLESVLSLATWVTLDMLINFWSVEWDSINDLKGFS